MLGVFTPTGRACCYHGNGIVQFLATENGGTLADPCGQITRRWSWPPAKGKLSASVCIEVGWKNTEKKGLSLFKIIWTRFCIVVRVFPRMFSVTLYLQVK